MIGFWIAAGLLLTGALLFVVPPLLSHRRHRSAEASHDEANVSVYKDQLAELDADLAAGTLAPDQHQQARREIERRLLEEVSQAAPDAAAGRHKAKGKERPRGGRRTAVVVAVAVPALAVSLYLVLGSPEGLDPKAVASGAQEQAHSLTPEQIIGMVRSLSERLEKNPEDPEGWVMLGRSYNVLQRFSDAAQAYANAVKRVPGDPQLLADYADTLAMAQGKTLQGEPEALVLRALEIDPQNVKALALAGTAAYQRKDYAAAAGHWQKILVLIPPESDMARSISGSIAEARSLGGGTAQAAAPAAPAAPMLPAAPVAAAPGPAGPPAAAPAGSGTAAVRGIVRLDPRLTDRADPGDTLFVFARAAEGPRVPLAIRRAQVKDLPLAFTLDDSMSMAPNMKLSLFKQVVVGARISKTGNALPQPGDLQGLTPVVEVGAAGLAIVINSEVK